MSQDEAGRSYGHSFSNWRASGSAENLMIRKCCFIRCFCSSFTTFHHFSWLFIACHTCKIWQQICHPLSCIKTPGINAPLVLTYIENYWNAFRGPNLQSGGQFHTRGMGLGRYVIYIYIHDARMSCHIISCLPLHLHKDCAKQEDSLEKLQEGSQRSNRLSQKDMWRSFGQIPSGNQTLQFKIPYKWRF